MGLFAMLDTEDKAAAIPIPSLPELSPADMMSMEKETTGVYISGHPMDDYRQYLKGTNVVSIGSLLSEESTYRDDQIVSVAGIVQNLKMKTTRNNSMMAYVTVEDDTGSIEMLAFSNVLGEHGGYLRENSAVVITGRLSIRDDKDPQIVINRARPITDYSEMPPITNHISKPQTTQPFGTLYLRLDSESDPRYRKIKAILNMFPGDRSCVLFFADTRQRRGTHTSFDSRMIDELTDVLGSENVVLK